MIPPGLHLVDTSAIARLTYGPVRAELDRLGRLGLLATCVTVDLEIGYSARDPVGYTRTAAARAAGFTDLPLHRAIGARAKEIQAMMARRSQHRAAGIIDILTAATAEHHAAVVLHYEGDFDHIAVVTGQQVRWVVPRGSAG